MKPIWILDISTFLSASCHHSTPHSTRQHLTFVNIWEQTGKNPSLRYDAFKILVSIAKKHPDLLREIKKKTESYYTDTLSDSVEKSITKLTKDLIIMD